MGHHGASCGTWRRSRFLARCMWSETGSMPLHPRRPERGVGNCHVPRIWILSTLRVRARTRPSQNRPQGNRKGHGRGMTRGTRMWTTPHAFVVPPPGLAPRFSTLRGAPRAASDPSPPFRGAPHGASVTSPKLRGAPHATVKTSPPSSWSVPRRFRHLPEVSWSAPRRFGHLPEGFRSAQQAPGGPPRRIF